MFSSEADSEYPAETGDGAAECSEFPRYDEASRDLQNFASDDESLHFHDEFTAREDKSTQAGVLSRDKSSQHHVECVTKFTECGVSSCDTSTQSSVTSKEKFTQYSTAEMVDVCSETCDLQLGVGCNTSGSSLKSESENYFLQFARIEGFLTKFLSMQLLQKVCPHNVVTGCKSKRRQSGQLKSPSYDF